MGAIPAVFRSFRDDHRRVLARLESIERLVVARPRARSLSRAAETELSRLVAHLREQFSTHMAAEDDLLFPALAEALPESLASLHPLRVEHAELRTMLGQLAGLLERAPGVSRDEQVRVQVRDFVDLLRIHIRKEEAAVIRVAARVLTPAEITRLAARLAVRSTDPAASPRRPTQRRKSRP